jgi:hypothetical protein
MMRNKTSFKKAQETQQTACFVPRNDDSKLKI